MSCLILVDTFRNAPRLPTAWNTIGMPILPLRTKAQLKKKPATMLFDMEPAALLARLCTSVPPPRLHTVRYAGVIAPAARLRPLVVPPPPTPSAPHAPPPRRTPTHRCAYRPWAELLRLTFKVDVLVCPKCHGRLKLLALVREPSSVARFLTPLGAPLEPPPLAPARGPPFFRPTARPDRRLVDVPGIRPDLLDFDHPA